MKKLPIGIEDFEKIQKDGFYYVDKTKLIEQLLEKWGEANLFTRPRRFGKSLNMSMLQHFFEIGADKQLFAGTYIAQNKELCEMYQARFPVVSISFKGINSDSYEKARAQLIKVINREARRLYFLLESPNLTEYDKEIFSELLQRKMEDDTLTSSIQEFTELLKIHYREKVILLIDEYDVPLAKASENGYYDQMTLLLRNLLENSLKTNSSLKFAVLTGCLRVAKESIFTGLNNFKVNTITDVEFDEYFGFTDAEVKEILHYYNQDSHYEAVKEWYDGYRFGNIDVYCPWDVINYCSGHISDPQMEPQNYWLNTSGNDVINHFIDSVGENRKLTKTELEHLVSGETVQKEIHQELTYNELYSTMDHLWSALFMTGYLTQRGTSNGKRYNLTVPNREIRNIITERILTRFRDNVRNDGKMLDEFCNALMTGQTQTVEELFTEYMGRTISVRDTFSRKTIKENFYHGILLGILAYKDGWTVSSNKESGDGFSDILVQIDDADVGIVIEVKYAEKGKEERDCRKALTQIIDKRYTEVFRRSGVHKILKYGFACNIKQCKVMCETEYFEE